VGKVNPMRGVDPSLAKLGFKRIKPVRRKCISMEVNGKTKSGKTRLCLTMPEPVGFINTDRSLQDILPEFPDLDIVLMDLAPMFAPGEPLNQGLARDIERKFATAYAGLWESGVKSIVVDKFTTMWEVARFAEFGVASVKAHHYVPVNMRMRGYIMKYQQYEKNLLLVHEVKEEWVNEKSTGRWIVDGFKYTPGLMQVNASMEREEDGDRDFTLTVTGCGLDADLTGKVFTNDEINFKEVAMKALPDTLPGDWK